MDTDTEIGPRPGQSRSEAEQERDRGRLARLRSRIGGRLGGLFSVRGFALALAGSVAGLFLGNTLIPIGGIAGVIGVLTASFVGGLVLRQAYVEWTLAGAVTGGVSVLIDYLVLTLATGAGINVAFIGAGAGAAAGLVGHYFGRDLRAGVTKDLG